MPSTLRFLKQHQWPSEDAVTATEEGYSRGTEDLPATVFRPAGARAPLPGWVLLHGLAYTGREHPALVRFASALAASGALVLVPEIPEWRALRMAPAISTATIRAAVIALAGRADVAPGRTGLIGFSFGATQALIAAADPALHGRLSGIAAWGGYYDVHQLFRFGITGRHSLDGENYETDPDPYGSWVAGFNYLTSIEGHESDGDVATALKRLAEEAGRRQLYAGSPDYDDFKREVRATLPPAKRELFDLFAAPTNVGKPTPADGERYERAMSLARRLADAALRTEPLLDPGPFLPRIVTPTLVAHARDDRLVPFTDATRICRALPDNVVEGCTVMGLFGHSGKPPVELGRIGLVRETLRFIGVLRGILGLA
ncbi:MAG: hypothetical protein ACRELV_03245 [Longimicrobiales bacterium]